MEGVSEPTTRPARPPQVTVAAWLIMVGSVFVVLMVWDRIAGLHSLDSRKALQAVLDDPGVKPLGLQVTDLMIAVKTVSMVAAGCATAMVILGYQTLRRSRGARLALTLLAVPLFFSGLVTGGFVSSGVAAAVATLWLRPARVWFDGGSGRTPSAHAEQVFGRSQGAPPPWTPPLPPGADPVRPSGEGGTSPAAWAPPPTSVYDVRRTDDRTAQRPAALLWACLLTWAFAGVAVLVLTASIAVLAGNQHLVLDKMHQQNPDLASQGVSDHLIVVVAFVTCGTFVLWSLAAAVFAALAFRRRRLAWYALTASTAAVAVVCLLGAIGSLLVLVPLVASLATISLLVRSEVRGWFG